MSDLDDSSSASSAKGSRDESQEEDQQTDHRLGSGGDIVSLDEEVCTSESLSLGEENDKQFYEPQEGTVSNTNSAEVLENESPADYIQDEEEVLVLAPDHPLLDNFHRSVHKHFLKQKEQLANDIRELAAKVKNCRQESDDVAETLYGIQQTVGRQHARLDLTTENAAANSELREELESCMKDLVHNHREEAKVLHEAQIFEEALWRKLGEKTEQDYAALQKEQEAESKLSLLRRKTEKASLDRKNLIEEKKKQDEFVYKLTCQVSDLQSLRAQLNYQIAAKDKEQAQLQQAVKAAGQDLEEQSRDQHQLKQVWQRLLVAAKNKDIELLHLQEKRIFLQEAVKIAGTASEEYRKGEELEKEKNDKLMLMYKRLQREKALRELQIRKELSKIEELQEQLDKTNSMVTMTEEDLKEVKRLNRSKESRKSFLENEMSNLLGSQLELERKILEALNEQTMQDKSVQFMIKKVDDMNTLIEQMETEKAQKEMQQAHVELDVQKLRHEEAQMNQHLVQQVEATKEAQKDVFHTEYELQTAQTELTVKQGKLDRLNSRLSTHLDRTGGKEMSPLETKISEMQENIQLLSEKIVTTQKTLLRKEVALMDKSEKINKLKREIGALQRSIENLQHKSRGQIEELEKLQGQRNQVKKKIEQQTLALAHVDQDAAKTQSTKSSLEKDNYLFFNDIQANIKGDEQQLLSLSEKLLMLGDERRQLYETLRLLQTEQVDLEAKLSLANETKQAVERERGSQGEMAAMKSEIHRMEVRLGQLKRAQEKLKLDLDQCVLRRDAMVDSARVRNAKHSIANTARLKSLRRFETVKYNNKQLKSKLDKYESDRVSLKAIEQEIDGLSTELDQKNMDISRVNEPLKATAVKMHTLKNVKIEKLEQLVHEQKLVRGLCDAKDGKYKILCKSESSLTTEAEKQRVVHSNLISIVESLQPDFPQYAPRLHSTSALLKSIKVNYPNLSATQSVQGTDDAASVQ